MKRLLVMVALFTGFMARADEGMWLPHLLGAQRYADMKAKGLKLTPEQLYSINKSSLKDAIIIFGGGCTGEIVSPEGLIFTNHHCGYSAIAGLSTMEANTFVMAFMPKAKVRNCPIKGLALLFLLKLMM